MYFQLLVRYNKNVYAVICVQTYHAWTVQKIQTQWDPSTMDVDA